MLILSPTSPEALGRPHHAPNFYIRRGAAAGGGGDEWPRQGNGHHAAVCARPQDRCVRRLAQLNHGPTMHVRPERGLLG
eukprot:scaffold133302_cov91-Phaeocystis_antarctica.AAC.1